VVEYPTVATDPLRPPERGGDIALRVLRRGRECAAGGNACRQGGAERATGTVRSAAARAADARRRDFDCTRTVVEKVDDGVRILVQVSAGDDNGCRAQAAAAPRGFPRRSAAWRSA